MNKSIVVLICLFLSFQGFTQSELREDFELWLSADVEYGLMKKTNANLTVASRYENNARFNKNNFAQLGIQFNQLKDISFSLAYRYNVKGSNNKVSQRFIATGSYEYRLKPLDLSYRLRLDNDTGNDDFLDGIRNKFQIKYRKKKKKYRPFVSYELFTSNKNKGWIADQYRAKIGGKYKLGKGQNIGMYYGIQSEFNTKSPQRDFILGTSYSYSID